MRLGSLVPTLLVRTWNQHKPCRRTIVNRSSLTVSPRRRCKTAARTSGPSSCSNLKLRRRTYRGSQPAAQSCGNFGKIQIGIRSGGLDHQVALAGIGSRPRLESNAHGDRNNLSVKSSGGRVVIARLEIEAVTGLAYLNSKTNPSIRTQGP